MTLWCVKFALGVVTVNANCWTTLKAFLNKTSAYVVLAQELALLGDEAVGEASQ